MIPHSSPSFVPAVRSALLRIAGLLTLSATIFVAACSTAPSGTTTTTNKEACYTKSPELRFWMRDTIAVALRLPPNAPATDEAINSAVLGAINPTLKDRDLGTLSPPVSADQKPSPVLRSGAGAIAFYTLAPASDSSLSALCDQRVISAVNAVNSLLKPDSRGSEGTVLKPLVVHAQAATSEPVSILGASPDWIFTGAPADGGWGHPGGPPRLIPGTFDPGEVQDGSTPAPSPTAHVPDGTATTVVVLDTGYQLDKGRIPRSGPVRCGTDLCAPPAQPITFSSKVAAALANASYLPLAGLANVLQESDMAVTTDSGDPAGPTPTQPPFEFLDAGGNPVNVVDHGLFISGLIHQAAPGAQIRLVRVLNDYGVGDLRSILTGVQTVAEHPGQLGIASTQRIVVNMSLSFGPSASCLVGTWRQWLAIQKANAQSNQPYAYDCLKNQARDDTSSLVAGGPAASPGVFAALTLPLSVAVSDLANANNDLRIKSSLAPIEAVVAAAGNESKGIIPALDADLPAGICGVVPVAADRIAQAASGGLTHARADFSNNPYLGTGLCLQITHAESAPGNVTSVTVSLIGETRPRLTAAGVNVCGIFLQNVPPAILTPGGSPTPASPTATSPSNMALWDGTSFATGFASGYVARQGVPGGASFAVPDAQKCNLLSSP
jgi:hypothetical protein